MVCHGICKIKQELRVALPAVCHTCLYCLQFGYWQHIQPRQGHQDALHQCGEKQSFFSLTALLTGTSQTFECGVIYVPLRHEITKYDSTKLIQGGKNRITAVKVFSWQSEERNITHTFLNVKDIKEMS